MLVLRPETTKPFCSVVGCRLTATGGSSLNTEVETDLGNAVLVGETSSPCIPPPERLFSGLINISTPLSLKFLRPLDSLLNTAASADSCSMSNDDLNTSLCSSSRASSFIPTPDVVLHLLLCLKSCTLTFLSSVMLITEVGRSKEGREADRFGAEVGALTGTYEISGPGSIPDPEET